MKWFDEFKKRTGLRVGSTKAGTRLPGGVVALIIALDLCLITTIFQGMGWTVEKLERPEAKISYTLLDLVRNPKNLWPNKVQLQPADRAAREWGLRRDDMPSEGEYIRYNRNELTSGKNPLGNSNLAKRADEELRRDWARTSATADNLSRVDAAIRKADDVINGLVDNYRTALSERTANMPVEKSLTPAPADEVLKRITAAREQLNQLIVMREGVHARLADSIDAPYQWLQQNKTAIEDQKKADENWYYIVIQLYQMLFVLPILVVAVLWHRKTLVDPTAEMGVLVSSHLLYVASFPVVCKVIEFIHNIFPYYIFTSIFTFLWEAGLQYIWSYAMIALGIGVVFLIGRWILSNRKKTKARDFLKCLEMGLCPRTGRRLPPGCRYSPYTGDPLMKAAEDGSGRDSYRYAPFCSQTGKPNPLWDDMIK